MSILRRMLDVGTPVQFVQETSVYDATTDTHSSHVDSTVDGHAVAIAGDPVEYARMNLIEQEPVTLLFVPDTDGEDPVPESSIVWDGETKRVRKVKHLALGAKVILV